jgi:hypothetical protein
VTRPTLTIRQSYDIALLGTSRKSGYIRPVELLAKLTDGIDGEAVDTIITTNGAKGDPESEQELNLGQPHLAT